MSTSMPLVLIPGTLCDDELFAHQLRDLPIAVSVANITRSDTIEGMADDVLAKAPSQFAVAGLSLGGIVAAEMLHRAPERILGLGLLDTNLDAASSAQIATRTRWASDALSGRFASMVADELVEPLTSNVERHGPAVFEMAMRVGSAAFLNQNNALMHRHDRRGVLDTVEVPVLVACGALDELTPRSLHDDLVQRCAFATKAVVPDAGHLSTIDQPAALTRVLGSWIQTCINTKHLQEGQENEHNFA
jgi:pimeloyl-ACP methyl ester carboxylesterase